jgi:hypothetical protein
MGPGLYLLWKDLLYSRHYAAPYRSTMPGFLYGLLGPLSRKRMDITLFSSLHANQVEGGGLVRDFWFFGQKEAQQHEHVHTSFTFRVS